MCKVFILGNAYKGQQGSQRKSSDPEETEIGKGGLGERASDCGMGLRKCQAGKSIWTKNGN